MWALLREDVFEFIFLKEEELKKILEDYSEQDIVVVELKHTWNKGIEELEKVVLENADVLLSYPFFRKKITKGNFSNIKDYIKQEIEKVKKLRKEGGTTISRLEGKKPDRTPAVYESKPIPNEKVAKFELFIKLWTYYNLIQEKIKEEIKGTPKIKSIETVPGNSLFINFQNIDKEVIKNSKTKLIFKPSEKLTVFQKATLLSLYYAILSCIKEGINQVSPNMFSFTLTNLMEVVGIPKRDWGDVKRGYSHEKKEEVLWLLTNVINKPLLSISVKSIDTETQKELKELLKDFNEENDVLYFNPFGVIYNVLTTKEKDKIIIKDAIIKIFVDDSLNIEAIKTFKTNIFRSKLDDPHYRLLAIWLDTGSRLGEKVKTTPKDLLKIAEIKIDYRHPERVKNKLGSMLDRAKGEEIIKDYEIEEYSRRNFKDWLESKCTILFNQKGGDKKK